jgi:hypothetical protein
MLPLKVVVVVEEDTGGTEVWYYINTTNKHIINQWFINLHHRNKNKFFEVYNFHSSIWNMKEKHATEDLKNYENILLPLLTVKIGLKE